ncbi:uncharacterized protein TNCV_2053601 [Trichonephila clavipes]|nr:uncharacterized protein TNCV_2053601 [Trichonephila clavipes]
MDPIDAFPEHLSTTVVPVTLPDKPDALEYAARQGQVRAVIIYQEPTAKRTQRRDVGKTSKDLLRNPDRLLKNTDKRMVYIYNNIFFAKKDFTFGLRTVKFGEIHLIQTTHVSMSIYELPASSLKCRAQPNVIRRSFEPQDQMLYHRTILEPHTAYPILAGTHYIVLTVQKTAFGLDIIPESLLPQLIQKGFHVGDFRKMKKFNQTPYKLPPPIPIHVPAEKRPLEEKALPKKRVRITPVMRCVSRRSELPMTPVQIPLVLEPVPIPDVLEPVPIPDVPPSLVQIPLVPQSPVQIPLVPQSPCADSRCPRTYADFPCPTITCADSSVTRPRTTCADSRCPRATCADSTTTCAASSVTRPTVTCADSTCAYSRCSRTCADSSVTSPTATCADSSVTSPRATLSQVPQPPMQILPEPMNILHVPEPVQIPDVPESVQIRVPQVQQPPVQILHVSEPVQIPVSHVPQPPMQILHVSEPVQIPVSHVPQSPVQSLPEPMQLLPELDMLDPLESTDAFDQLMSFVFGPQELQLLHTVPSIFDENLFSFLD